MPCFSKAVFLLITEFGSTCTIRIGFYFVKKLIVKILSSAANVF